MNKPLDLLVVGGGIYGLWIAADAAGRGLRTALVEQDDFGGATSCASSKLIHGGLRYLERFELGLVRHSLAERRLLTELAPHRVRTLRFAVPIYKDGRFGAFSLRMGLWLYDRLAGSRADLGGRRREPLEDLEARCPWLRTDGLTSAFSYADAQTDDARFTRDVVRIARNAGAQLLDRNRVVSWLRDGNRVVGAKIQDRRTHETREIRATACALAAGPWTATILPEDSSVPPPRRTKGVHIALPGVGLDHAFLLTHPIDGRVFFVMPWYNRTLIGTTDTDDPTPPDRMQVESRDVEYLLAGMNAYRRDAPWKTDDVRAAWCGQRTLRSSSRLNPSAASREWKFLEARPGLWAALGGKFTSARADAACAVDRLMRKSDRSFVPSRTASAEFPGVPPKPFADWLESTVASAVQTGLDPQAAMHLARRHGTEIDGLLDLVRSEPTLAERIDPELPFVVADLVHAWEHEQPGNMEDLLVRRVPLARVARASTLRAATLRLGEHLGWTEAERTTRADEAAALDSLPT